MGQRLMRVFNIDFQSTKNALALSKVIDNIEETVGPRRCDQADTCTPGEESGITIIQPITREQDTAMGFWYILVENNQLLARTVHEFSGITVNNGEKDRFWIGFRELILADSPFILLILFAGKIPWKLPLDL